MIGDGCGASDWACGKNLLCCLVEACSRHRKASCLTWRNLLPHIEMLAASLGATYCLTWSHLLSYIEVYITSLGKTYRLTISQAQKPRPTVIYTPTRAWVYTSPYGHPTWLEQFRRLSPDEDRRCDNHEDRGRRGADGPILPV